MQKQEDEMPADLAPNSNYLICKFDQLDTKDPLKDFLEDIESQ